MQSLQQLTEDRYPESLEEELNIQWQESLLEKEWTGLMREQPKSRLSHFAKLSENREQLVLGGGGNLGFVHLGALDIMDKALGTPDWVINHFNTFVGASIGALISYYLYARRSPRLIIHRLLPMFLNREIQKLSSAWRVLMKGGMLSLDLFEGVVREFLIQLDLDPMITMDEAHACYGEAGERKFACAVANVSRCRTDYVDYQKHPHLPIARALALSMAYPGLVSLGVLGGEEYTDGGLFSMVPSGYTDPKRTVALHADSQSHMGNMIQVSPEQVGRYNFAQMIGVLIYSMNYRMTEESLKSDIGKGLSLLRIPAASEDGIFEISMEARRKLIHQGRMYMYLIFTLATFMASYITHCWHQTFEKGSP